MEIERTNLGNDEQEAFTHDELRERAKRARSYGLVIIKDVGMAFAMGGVAGVSGYLACGRAGGKLVSMARSRSGSQPVESQPIEPPPIESQPVETQPESNPPPELGEFRDIVNATLNPDFESRRRSPREVLWVGAKTAQGDHTDMFLIIDNTVNPPRIKITGLAYKIPVAEPKREPPKVTSKPVAAVEAPIGLGQLRAKLIAEHFPKHFGSRIQPVEDAFIGGKTKINSGGASPVSG